MATSPRRVKIEEPPLSPRGGGGHTPMTMVSNRRQSRSASIMSLSTDIVSATASAATLSGGYTPQQAPPVPPQLPGFAPITPRKGSPGATTNANNGGSPSSGSPGGNSPGLNGSFGSSSNIAQQEASAVFGSRRLDGHSTSLFRLASLRLQQQINEGEFVHVDDRRVKDRDRSVPIVRHVIATINERSKQRFEDTVRYMKKMRDTKPPPPMSLDEMEEHPLLRAKHSKRRGGAGTRFKRKAHGGLKRVQPQQQGQQGHDGAGDAAGNQSQLQDEESDDDLGDGVASYTKLPLLTHAVKADDLRHKLMTEVRETEGHLLEHQTFTPTRAMVTTQRELRLLEEDLDPHGPHASVPHQSLLRGSVSVPAIEDRGEETPSATFVLDIPPPPTQEVGFSGGSAGGGPVATNGKESRAESIDWGRAMGRGSIVPSSGHGTAKEQKLELKSLSTHQRETWVGQEESPLTSRSCSTENGFPSSLVPKPPVPKIEGFAAFSGIEHIEDTDDDDDEKGASKAFLTQGAETAREPKRHRSLGGASHNSARLSYLGDNGSGGQSRRTSRRGSFIQKGTEQLGNRSMRDLTRAKQKSSLFERDPQDFIRLRNEDKHEQTYRGGKFKPKVVVGGKADPHAKRGFRASDVSYFLDSLKHREHEFNKSAMDEFDRVRLAQLIFRQQKSEELNRLLDAPHLFAAPGRRVIGLARARVVKSSRQKDHDERLDVFFDHLSQLEEHALDTFPEEDHKRVRDCLAAARKVVRSTNGQQGKAEFAKVAKRSFRPEHLFLKHVAELLALLSPMFGMDTNAFRNWLHEKHDRFDSYDYEEKFRKTEREKVPGSELTVEARFRVTIYAARGVYLQEENLRPEYRAVIRCERHKHSTSICNDEKPTWNDAHFTFHVYNQASPVNIMLRCGEQDVGSGTFSVARFTAQGAGKQVRMWVPCMSDAYPNCKVNVGIDVLAKPKMQMSTLATAVERTSTALHHEQHLAQKHGSPRKQSELNVSNKPDLLAAPLATSGGAESSSSRRSRSPSQMPSEVFSPRSVSSGQRSAGTSTGVLQPQKPAASDSVGFRRRMS